MYKDYYGMTDRQHPLRDTDIHLFKRMHHNNSGHEFLAKFYPYKAWPIYFYGPTEKDCTDQAIQFRADALAEHGASFLARLENLKKAREARK